MTAHASKFDHLQHYRQTKAGLVVGMQINKHAYYVLKSTHVLKSPKITTVAGSLDFRLH